MVQAGGKPGDFEEILTDHHPMETSGAEVKMDFRLLLDLMWSDPYEKVTQSWKANANVLSWVYYVDVNDCKCIYTYICL